MRTMALDTLPLDTLVRVWNGVYADYFVPMTRDADQLRSHLETGSVDASLSRLWFAGEEPVGLSLLGVRGERGWVGGFGVIPSHRGAGLATRMIRDQLDVAAAAGLARVGLEVLADNPARHLYERAGFTTTRLLHVLTGTLAPSGGGKEEAWWSEASPEVTGQLTSMLPSPAPWGREAAYLPADPVVLGAGDPASPSALLLLRRTPAGWSLLAGGAATRAAAAAVVGRLATDHEGTDIRVVNEPEGSPLVEAFESVGVRRKLLQHEMSVYVA